MSDIIDRLNEACKGYPAAWPHRLLHDAISEIERLRGVAQAAIEPEARFLLDRLQEFDPGDFDAEREFYGHVAPAIARLRSALSSTSLCAPPSGLGDGDDR